MTLETTLLTSVHPTNVAPAAVTIGHVQLRDVVVCPRERGIVNYIQKQSIVEQNINIPDSTPRQLASLAFTPNTLASMQVPGTDYMLLAAGGQEAEIHLSLHKPPTVDASHRQLPRQRSSAVWQFEAILPGSINNSVLLTSMSLARSNQSSIEPRVGISNNDSTVKFYDVPVRGDTAPNTIHEAGMLRLDVPVNHSSLSPDGRILLSVGDSPKVYLHHLSGSSHITFAPITTLSLPPPDSASLYYTSSCLAASFSTAFSSDGTKYAVASQEGSVVVWDVRSSKPLKVFQTKKKGGSNAYLSEDPWDWTRGPYRAPGWGVRSVKFGCGDSGRELMTFTEHTSILHVVDAQTFETEEIVRMPSCAGQEPPKMPPVPSPRIQSPSTSRSISPVRTAPQFSSSPPPPRILLALEETFRISGSSSADHRASLSASRRRASRLRNRLDAEEDDEGIVVIPPLGDVAVENEVRQLFGRHGIRTRHYGTLESGSRPAGVIFETGTTYDAAAEDERERERENGEVEPMEVDELESDCLSSHTPSRSSSPTPSTHIPLQVSPSPLRVTPHYRHHSQRRQTTTQKDDLDLAGMCFDPSGSFVYVASVDGVAEWSVRGAGKRWWLGSEWV